MMEKVSTLGERVKEARMALPNSPSLEEIGSAIGMSKQTLSRIELNQGKRVKQPIIDALAKCFGVNHLWLMGYNVDKYYLTTSQAVASVIPILGTISAGSPILAQENIIGYAYDLSGKGDFALKVKGDSMINARIFDNDIVIIREQQEVENGEIAAVLFDGEEATIKRIFKDENSITLHAENPTIPDRRIVEGDYNDLKIIGKVIQVVFNV